MAVAIFIGIRNIKNNDDVSSPSMVMEPTSDPPPMPPLALPEPTPSPTPPLESPDPMPSTTPVLGTPAPTPSPTPSITNPFPVSNGYVIAIDPGHQISGNYGTEPIGPGSSTRKAKVTTGTRGVSTRVPEYQLNLDISLQLRDELIERGYTVVMIREINEVDITNIERAQMATDAGADAFIRVHANGSENSSVHGMLMITTSRNNPYVSHLFEDNKALSEAILLEMVEATGARNMGVIEMDNMSGSNWSTMPVTIIEMGFMTNAEEDERMQNEEYQQKLVIGIANGIDRFFDGR